MTTVTVTVAAIRCAITAPSHETSNSFPRHPVPQPRIKHSQPLYRQPVCPSACMAICLRNRNSINPTNAVPPPQHLPPPALGPDMPDMPLPARPGRDHRHGPGASRRAGRRQLVFPAPRQGAPRSEENSIARERAAVTVPGCWGSSEATGLLCDALKPRIDFGLSSIGFRLFRPSGRCR